MGQWVDLWVLSRSALQNQILGKKMQKRVLRQYPKLLTQNTFGQKTCWTPIFFHEVSGLKIRILIVNIDYYQNFPVA